jgi:3-oxosteroid 1-dehydrogenase
VAPSVVVVGSGAAGMAAALAAASQGASVTLLEAADLLGGTAAISGGVVWIPGSPWAAAAGVDDTPDEGLEYLRGLALGDVDWALCETYVREGVRVVRSIEERAALRWQLMRGFPDYHAEIAGGKAGGRGLEILPIRLSDEIRRRIRPDPYEVGPLTINEAGAGQPSEAELERRVRDGIFARGPGLIGGMLAAIVALAVDVRISTRAISLVTASGRVVGVEADGTRFDGQVVLASGGFERNPALVRTFLRGPLLAPAGPPSNRGDGLLMGMTLGAALGNMSEAWWCPAMEVPGETIDGAPFFRVLFTDCAHPGGLVVDSAGRRFADESANYSDFGRAFHDFDSGGYSFPRETSWLVFDSVRRAERAFVGDTVWSLDSADARASSVSHAELEPDPDWLVRSETLEGLAERIGILPTRMRGTVARFNQQAARGVDDDFGRGSYVYDRMSQGGATIRPVDRPPFYAVRVIPGSLGTKGGLRTDGLGRVLRVGGGVIPGLYAAGNVAANPFGCAYPGPGATVGPAVVFGSLAGETAARSVSVTAR